jgi:hypothetical protein
MRTIIALLIFFVFVSQVLSSWLVWTAPPPEDQVSQYKIYRVSGSNAQLVGTTTPPTTSFEASKYVIGNRSTFYVIAVNIKGDSIASSKVTVQRK